MKHLNRGIPVVFAVCLALLASCGSREPSQESPRDAEGAAGAPDGGGEAAARSFEGLAIKPLPEDSTLQLRFSGSLTAERDQVDKDPLGPRSNFKVARSVELSCRMRASSPQGIGPDGPTAEQKAVMGAAEAQSSQASAELQAFSGSSELEARVAACGDDEGCKMNAALQMASDPKMQAEAAAMESRNAAVMSRVEEASARMTAVQTEPNWQLVTPDSSPDGSTQVCEGSITVDDREVYRLGFDGGDMGEGVETRKGQTPLAGGPTFYLWYDLKRGGLIVDVQLNSIRGDVKSVNVGGRKFSRNEGFGFNEDWAATAGEFTRFERASGVAAVPGEWTFALPITPAVHQGFGGKIDARISIATR